MKKQEFKLTLPDGTTDAVLYTSDDSRPQPGALFIPDVGGPREVVSETAERVVNEGYTVLVPNPFYRTSEPPVFKFPRKQGDPATMQRTGELLAPLTPVPRVPIFWPAEDQGEALLRSCRRGQQHERRSHRRTRKSIEGLGRAV